MHHIKNNNTHRKGLVNRFNIRSKIPRTILALAVSFLVFSLIFSNQISIGMIAQPPKPLQTEYIDGDWIITDTNMTQDKTLIVNGSVIVTETGNLTLINTTLKINSLSDGQYKIQVNTTGEFHVYDSMITAYNTAFKYRFEVYGKLWTNHSTVEYMWGDEWNAPYTGGIQIYGAGSEVWLNHTNVWRSGANGIHAIGAVGVNITGNSNITENTRNEVWVENSRYFNLTYSNFTDFVDARIGDGIRFVNSSDVVIDHCWIAHHQSEFILCRNVSNLSVVSNRIGSNVVVLDNWGNGITLEDSFDAYIAWNNISNLQGSGVLFRKKSSATIENNNMSNCEGSGIYLFGSGSNANIYNNTMENNGGSGIMLRSSNATIINNTLWADNIMMFNSYARIENCYIKGSSAISLNASSPLVINTTIDLSATGNPAFYLKNDSHTIALNCSVTYWERERVEDTSNLTVQNYIHARVVEPDGTTPIQNAWMNVTDNGVLVYSGLTSLSGEVQWIIVTNRTYLQDYWNIFHPFTNITYNETVVRIEKDGYVFADNPRIVGLDASHWEVFQAIDTTLPIITHTPVTSAKIGELINITANVTDDVAVDSVFLNYTGVNGTNHNVSMNRWGENFSYDIPGQGNTGFVEYFIWANDTSGNSNRTVPHQIQIFDITEPKIYHVPVISANVSEIINITANVTDDVGVGSVYLNYIDVNETSYNVSMQKWNGNWSYEISGQSTIGNVRYFIWANDTSGNTNQTAIHQVQINDVTKPEIIHSPVTSANANEAINITAEISDDVGVDSVYLNYTDVHGNNFNVTMQKWNGKYSYDIPGQDNIGIVEYFIWASDTSGNTNMTINYTIQIFDVNAPAITHTPPPATPLDTPIVIVTNVTDDVGVANVALHYQNVGDTTYTMVDMVFISDNWVYEIPAQNKTGTAHYYIRANDTSGNNATSPTMGDYSILITGPPSIVITEPKGWEIFTGGSEQRIEFIASDTEDSLADLTVFLNYTSGAGDVFIAQVTGASSPYSWTLPRINATDVRINATVIDSDGNKTYDDSLEFTIDSSPPEIISTNPVNNTTGISIFQPIVIQFNEPMNISSVVVNQTNGTDPGNWQWFWNQDKDTITGTHDAWLRGDNVELTVQAGYMDDTDPGNVNNTAYVFSFLTEINPSPEIMHTNISGPVELGDEIRINATITDDGTVMNAVLWWRDVDGVWRENQMQKNGDDWFYIVPGQMTEGRVRYQINATDDLGQRNSTAIYEFDVVDTTPPVITHTPVANAVIGESINITCLVTDLGGVDAVYLHYRNDSAENFTQVMMSPGYWYELAARSEPGTIEYYIMAVDQYGNEASTGVYSLEIIDPTVPDTMPPEIWFAGPTGTGMPVTTSISIVFSEAVDRASVENAITVSPAIIGIIYTWLNDQTLIVSFNALQYNTTYTVIVGTGATDLAGNTLASAYSWEFTTATEPEIVQQPAPNNWGWIGLIIFLIVIIALMLLYLLYKEKKEPDNTKKE